MGATLLGEIRIPHRKCDDESQHHANFETPWYLLGQNDLQQKVDITSIQVCYHEKIALRFRVASNQKQYGESAEYF